MSVQEALRELRLLGMLNAFEEQMADPRYQELPFAERFALIVDYERTKRQNARQGRLIREARFRIQAFPEDVDFSLSRGLDRGLFLSLCREDWIERRQNVMLTGPTGSGKTFIACALGHAACRHGLTSRYYRVGRLLTDVTLALGDGSFPRLLDSLVRVKLLILDDWGLDPLSDAHGRALLDLLDERVGQSSTIIASQLPIDDWHAVIQNPTVADAIMDRLVHTSHRLELRGESMRKLRGSPLSSG